MQFENATLQNPPITSLYSNTGIVCHYSGNHRNLHCTREKGEKTWMKQDVSGGKQDVRWEKQDTSLKMVVTYFWAVQ